MHKKAFLANEKLFMIILVIMIVHYNYNRFMSLASKKDQVKYNDSFLHFTYSWNHFPASPLASTR